MGRGLPSIGGGGGFVEEASAFKPDFQRSPRPAWDAFNHFNQGGLSIES